MKKYGFTLGLLLLWATVAGAQPYCQVKTFNLRDGLASNAITGLTQTPDQLLWFSTWNGLTCYDGYRFTNYSDHSRQRTLTTNRLLNIQPSQTGNVWCVTYDLHPFLFERRSSRFVDVGQIIRKQFGEEFRTNRAIPMHNGHTWLLNIEEGQAVYRVDDAGYASKGGITRYEPTQGPIHWVVDDADGDEWIISRDGITLLGGKFSDKRPFRFVQQIGKQVYLASLDGTLSRYDKQTGKLTDLTTGTRLHHVRSLLQAADRWLIIVADEGVLVCDIDKGSQQLVATPHPIDEHTLKADSRDRLWAIMPGTAGTADAAVSIGLTDGSLTVLPAINPPTAISQSNSALIHEDRHHTIWVATAKGFFGYYDEAHGRLAPWQLRTSITQPAIGKAMTDSQGNIWYAGEHNLAMASPQFRHVTHVDDLQEVRSVMFDREGRLWAGTLDGQIAIFGTDGRRLGFLGTDGRLAPTATRFSTRIYRLFQDNQGNIWIGSKGDGLFRLSPQGQLKHYRHDATDKASLPSDQVYDIHQDHQGRIWVGTFERGIALLQEDAATGQARFLHAGNGLTGYPIDEYHKVRRITETPKGEMIVSASNGLVTFSEHFQDPAMAHFYGHKHTPGDSTSLMTDDVMQTYVTGEDSIFVATVGGGLQLIRDKSVLQDKLTLHTISRLVADYGTIMGMVQDHRHNFWVSRENSINMFDHATFQLWRFGPSHIGEHTELTEAKPAICANTGRLAFATTDGLISFLPERLEEDDFVPPLVFTGVQLHGQQEVQQMMVGDTLEVAADERNLTIQFAALDYSDNYLIRYAYKLEGIDRDWNILGTEHSISFSNLPHGHHRLLIRCTNAYGTWIDNVATLHIYAHPTFWETWWAKLLYLLLVLGLVGVAVWIYRLHTRASLERKLNDMKTQFFTDVSHKLRTPLTLIGGPVTQVLQAGGLTDTARKHLEMVERNARRMLDLVNKMLTYSKEHHTYISDMNVPEAAIEANTTAAAMAVSATDDKTGAAETISAEGAGEGITPPTEEKTRLLIVEDNDDLRTFLVSILQSDYDVTQAVNGREGLEKAQQEMPDFILTDVMMPEMDGLTMVHHIKADKNISHIPIVILSAKASMDDRLEGLRAGVHDYITKPFSATYLKQRMQNIIANQRMMQQSYLEQMKETPAAKQGKQDMPDTPAIQDIPTIQDAQDIQGFLDIQDAQDIPGHSVQQPTPNIQQPTPNTQHPSPNTHPISESDGPTIRLTPTTIVDSDKEMMERLMAYIDENISNADLKIEDLASAVCLGRTVFYNKVKSLVGMSPVELLRYIRIQRAEDMVAKSNEPFSQIAYSLGFSDSRYFGKCFKKQTGMTPSEYRERRV